MEGLVKICQIKKEGVIKKKKTPPLMPNICQRKDCVIWVDAWSNSVNTAYKRRKQTFRLCEIRITFRAQDFLTKRENDAVRMMLK